MRYQLKTARIKESVPQFIGLPDDAIILSAEYRPVTMLTDSKPTDTRLLFLQYLLPIGEEENGQMLDMTDTPRSDKDIEDAIFTINLVRVKHPSKIPLLTVHCGVIADCLKELQQRRKSDAQH